MTTRDVLDGWLLDAGVSGKVLNEQDLRLLHSHVLRGPDDDSFHDLIDVLEAEDHLEGLALRVGNYQIDLTKAAVRTALLTAAMSAVLAAQGAQEFGLAFITAVLPTVFDIERVEVSAGDRLLLAKVLASSDFGDASELYRALPGQVRNSLNEFDFVNFLERLDQLGLIQTTANGRMLVLPAP